MYEIVLNTTSFHTCLLCAHAVMLSISHVCAVLLVHIEMKNELQEERGQHREELMGKMQTLRTELLGELLSSYS